MTDYILRAIAAIADPATPEEIRKQLREAVNDARIIQGREYEILVAKARQASAALANFRKAAGLL